MGRLVELAVLVEVAVEESDALAHRAGAALSRRGRQQRQDASVDPIEEPRILGLERAQGMHAHCGQQVRDMEPALETGLEGGDQVHRHLRADGGADSLESGEHRHAERGGAETVGHHLHGVGAGQLSHAPDRRGIVVAGDVVGARRGGGGREIDRGAIVEQPDVPAPFVEELEQVGGDGLDGEDEARHAQAGGEDHRPLVASAVAAQPQLDAVARGHGVGLGQARPQPAS